MTSPDQPPDFEKAAPPPQAPCYQQWTALVMIAFVSLVAGMCSNAYGC